MEPTDLDTLTFDCHGTLTDWIRRLRESCNSGEVEFDQDHWHSAAAPLERFI